METFNLLITCSNKWWNDPENINSMIRRVAIATQNQFKVQIYSTGNRVDEIDLCEKISHDLGFEKQIVMRPDFSKHGTKAVYLRNLDLINIIDAAIVFHNGHQKSEMDIFNLCNSKNKPCKLYRFNVPSQRK